MEQIKTLKSNFLRKFKTSRIAVLVPTEQDFKDFCKWLGSFGVNWSCGIIAGDKSMEDVYSRYGKDTCLIIRTKALYKIRPDGSKETMFHKGLALGNIRYFKHNQYKIIKYDKEVIG